MHAEIDVMEGMEDVEELHRPAVDDSSALLVKFFIRPRLDEAASAEADRPIYREVEYVDIRIPGSPDNRVRPATPRDKARFPKHYAAFKNRVSQEMLEGTPLAEWPQITRSQVEELAFFGVKTVEQLAGMSDANAQQSRAGFVGLKTKAKEWLDKMHSVETLESELANRDATIATLTERLEALEKAAKPKTTKKVTAKKE